MQNDPMNALSAAFNPGTKATAGAPGVATVMGQNKDKAKMAAVDAVGRAGNAAVLAAVKPHLPLMVKGYADHPVANILAANLVNVAIQQTGVGGTKGRAIADAMLTSAYMDLGRSFDVAGIINGLIDKVPSGQLTTLMGGEAE